MVAGQEINHFQQEEHAARLQRELHLMYLKKTQAFFPIPHQQLLQSPLTSLYQTALFVFFSTAGELVKQESNISGTDHSVAVSGLSAGIYFIETNDGEEISHLRFIKN